MGRGREGFHRQWGDMGAERESIVTSLSVLHIRRPPRVGRAGEGEMGTERERD